ncbi:MAG: coenzyme F420-0:L-glutamate ligase [Chloroflexi bacterium]|nr:coenzyme F420-0:L-glutamate ligase [Chloroflexota bacterium]
MSPREPRPRTVVVDGRTFERVPVRTRVLLPGDDIASAIREHAGDELRPGDTVLLSESAVAIMQGRARDWRTIHPGRLARFLSSRVIRTSWGTGLRSPYAMQYAIELTGTWRILAAGTAHVAGRLLGRKGWFYLVAGLNARMMDAEHTMGVAEFHECCIPAPADPAGTVRAVKVALGGAVDVAIADINDIAPAWVVASTLPKDRARLLARSFDDNPLGQTDEKTPLGIWREVAPA